MGHSNVWNSHPKTYGPDLVPDNASAAMPRKSASSSTAEAMMLDKKIASSWDGFKL